MPGVAVVSPVVLVTLFFPKGIGGVFDAIAQKKDVDRQGDFGPDQGAWRDNEGEPS